MVLDSSAIVSIVLRQPGHDRLVTGISQAEFVAVGAPTLAEAAIVLTNRLGRNAVILLAEFLREAAIEVIPFGRDHYEIAVDAYARFGKGRHPAALNFGDCLTYSVARISGMPLLFTGDDFSKTDLRVASGT